MKKKNKSKKPRIVTGDIENQSKDRVLLGYLYNPQTTEVRLVEGDDKGLINFKNQKVIFNGENKLKTRYLEVSSSKFFVNPDEGLLGFDVIFAIDTNTKIILGKKISICSIIEYPVVKKTLPHGEDAEVSSFTDVGVVISPERFFWHILFLTSSFAKYSDKKVALITDHDRGNLSEYNRRKLAYFKENFLPNNVTLIYASSDSGNDTFANQLISTVEDRNKMFLRAFESGGKVCIKKVFPEGNLHEIRMLDETVLL